MKQVKNQIALFIALVIVASSLLMSCSSKSESHRLIFGIQPPFGDQIKFDSLSFEAEEGCKLTTNYGSMIEIPPLSLVDENGIMVKGSVDLLVREFYSTADILLSGIVMQLGNTTDSVLSSGGMIDIRAFQDGKELFLSMEKKASIALPTTLSSFDGYELFKLENDSIWSEGNNFERTENKVKDSLIALYDSLIQNKDKLFKLRTDAIGRPNLRPWVDIEWSALSVKSELKLPEIEKTIWEYITLETFGDSITFKIELTSALYWNNGNEKRFEAELIAQPNLTPQEIARRIRIQNEIEIKEGQAYRKAIEEQKRFEVNYEQERREWIAAATLSNEIRKKELEKYTQRLESFSSLMSSFQLASFGIYNIDKAMKLNPIALIPITLKSTNDNSFELMLALPDKNTVIRIYDHNNLPVYEEPMEVYFVDENARINRIKNESLNKMREEARTKTNQRLEVACETVELSSIINRGPS